MNPRQHIAAFSYLELLAVLAVILILLLVLVPFLAGRERPAERVCCVSNLKNIGLAFRLFAVDHNDRFPAQTFTNQADLAKLTAESYLAFVTNELRHPKRFYCPSDKNRRSAKLFRRSTGPILATS